MASPVPTFPPPQTFDIIPPLHDLLQRLLLSAETLSSNQAADEAALASAPAAATPSSSQPQPGAINVSGHPNEPLSHTPSRHPGSIPGESSITSNSNLPISLDVKDLPTESSSIRIRIQKARAEVDALPDVHRSVADQEQEIAELEDRIACLRSVIADFGRRAGYMDPEKMDTR